MNALYKHLHHKGCYLKPSNDLGRNLGAMPPLREAALPPFGLSPVARSQRYRAAAAIAWYRLDRWCIALFDFTAFETLVCLFAAAFMGVALAVQL
jgi:hypothetical protein